MSNYINLRPAGMSDDEDDEDDFFFSYNKDIKVHSNSPKKDVTNEETIEYRKAYDLEEESTLESDVINACITGDIDVVQKYLYTYQDANKSLTTGWTLLLYAALYVQPKIMHLLLEHGADPNKHKDGFTPLMALCDSTKGTTVDSLECLKLLVNRRDVNNIVGAVSKQRETALMYACKSQDVLFVNELLQYITDVNAADCDGKTALMYAVAANRVEIVKILLEHNADTLLTDRNYLTAKDIADIKGFTEIYHLLDKDEEVVMACEVSQVTTWKDLFPDLFPSKKILDYDISTILYGMSLERYSNLFKGMDLKVFLQLTEDDICNLGIDISVHKGQFLESLEKFHSKKWHTNSLGIVKKSNLYTIYDSILSLANVKKQIGVTASTFQYIKNNLTQAEKETIYLSSVERIRYEDKLRKMQKALKNLRIEIMLVQKLARKADKENDIGAPAVFIGPKKNTFFLSNLTTVLSITLMTGLCIHVLYTNVILYSAHFNITTDISYKLVKYHKRRKYIQFYITYVYNLLTEYFQVRTYQTSCIVS